MGNPMTTLLKVTPSSSTAAYNSKRLLSNSATFQKWDTRASNCPVHQPNHHLTQCLQPLHPGWPASIKKTTGGSEKGGKLRRGGSIAPRATRAIPRDTPHAGRPG